ncbi:MAG: threonine/serine dehydratase [Anaerolineae bacterium]|nr:threonine/serine dehydratase [Anaerolineae bacterium]
MQEPTFQDVLLAKRQIAPYLRRTPLHRYPALDELMGTATYIKHENYQPVGAFKVRGGVNLISQMSEAEKARGVIAASTGNHGQSVAFAARLFGVRAQIVVPEGANPGKVAAMRGMGAEIIFHGERFNDAKNHCETLAAQHGYRYIHSGDEPLLIAGVATEGLEMLEDEPDLDVIFVPVGGGSGAAGCCLAAKSVNPKIKVIGVQAEASPAAYLTWKTRTRTTAPDRTIAEGLATGAPFDLPQGIMQRLMDDFVLVSDAAILQAVAWLAERAHTLAEGAGASTLAAAYQHRAALTGQKVGLVCSGGNISLAQLRLALSAGS